MFVQVLCDICATVGVGGYGVGGLHDIWCGWQSVLILYLFSMPLLVA